MFAHTYVTDNDKLYYIFILNQKKRENFNEKIASLENTHKDWRPLNALQDFKRIKRLAQKHLSKTLIASFCENKEEKSIYFLAAARLAGFSFPRESSGQHWPHLQIS